jgi:hypothetical protein
MDNDENTAEHWLSIFKQFLIDNEAAILEKLNYFEIQQGKWVSAIHR